MFFERDIKNQAVVSCQKPAKKKKPMMMSSFRWTSSPAVITLPTSVKTRYTPLNYNTLNHTPFYLV
jgi:hypothetical protein